MLPNSSGARDDADVMDELLRGALSEDARVAIRDRTSVLPRVQHLIAGASQGGGLSLRRNPGGRLGHGTHQRRTPGKLTAAVLVGLVVAVGGGFTVGRASNTPSPRISGGRSTAVAVAVEGVVQSLIRNGAMDLLRFKLDSVQVKEMTNNQFAFGIGSAWKTSNAMGCNHWPGGVGPSPSVWGRTDIFVMAIYGQWTQVQQNLPQGITPARHYTVAMAEVDASGRSAGTALGFGFPPKAPDGAPLCWSDLPNIGGQ